MRFTLAGGWCCAIVAILILAAAVPCPAQVSLRAGKSAGDDDRLEQALLRRGSLDVVDTPLSEVIASLSQQFHVPIVLAKRRLEEAGVTADTPITAQIDSLPLESLLEHALRELELAFTVRGGVILVTTPEDLESDLETRVYPVRDLVLWRVPGAEIAGDRWEADYDSLIDLIKTTLSPDTWDDVGGPGSIMEFDKSASIVVSQTRDVHRQIEPLLATLRKARELQGIASIPVPKTSALILPRIADGPAGVASSPPAQVWQMPRVYSE